MIKEEDTRQRKKERKRNIMNKTPTRENERERESTQRTRIVRTIHEITRRTANDQSSTTSDRSGGMRGAIE